MKDKTLILCPIKETNVYRYVCLEECTWNRDRKCPDITYVDDVTWEPVQGGTIDGAIIDGKYYKYNNEEEVWELCDIERHIGCPSYPNCDIDPLGCILEMGEDVELFGHKG